MRMIALLAASLSCLALPALAQNYRLTAHYGEIHLRAGFSPDPYVISMQAGGNVNGANLGGSCVGYISNAPDFQITYTAGSYPLIFRTNSSSDTTLVVNGPDGRWYCNDDGYGNLNAQVRFNSPRSGVYDIWVGNWNSSALVPARLIITEIP